MHLPASSRIGIYARYSSDLQNPSSVDDQVKFCHDLIADQFGGDHPILVFKDAAISGATMPADMLDGNFRKRISDHE